MVRGAVPVTSGSKKTFAAMSASVSSPGQTARSLVGAKCLLQLTLARLRKRRAIIIMDHPEFTRLFDQEFAYPLFDHGFSFVGSGKTLRYVSGNRDLRIVRQGGKLVRPRVMRSVICFRHIFLRPLNSDD